MPPCSWHLLLGHVLGETRRAVGKWQLVISVPPSRVSRSKLQHSPHRCFPAAIIPFELSPAPHPYTHQRITMHSKLVALTLLGAISILVSAIPVPQPVADPTYVPINVAGAAPRGSSESACFIYLNSYLIPGLLSKALQALGLPSGTPLLVGPSSNR